MISSAELDPPAIAAQSELLKEALCKSEHGCFAANLARVSGWRAILDWGQVRGLESDEHAQTTRLVG
jgi:hypothetical protein